MAKGAELDVLILLANNSYPVISIGGIPRVCTEWSQMDAVWNYDSGGVPDIGTVAIQNQGLA